jgi:hypothetical protein
MTLLLCRESPKEFDLLQAPDYPLWRQGLQVDSKERARIGRKSRNATPVRSALFESSALPLQCAPLRSALFTHKMSHCVSGPQLGTRCPKRRLHEERLSFAVLYDQIGKGFVAADLAGRLRWP